MKSTLLCTAIAAALLASGCMTPVGAPSYLSWLGVPAPESAAMRSIVIAPDTRWVNVTGGETIRFLVGDKSFAWYFNGPETASPFDMRRIAPQGVLDRQVLAYVAPNPLYMGRGDGGHL
jgi:hypothetical protein